FMNLPNELKGELNYTFFPSGVCEQLPLYDSYDVRDISIANVQIMNSDIQNAYMHNATVQNCNIEDATFINSTIFNCWIGDNVTFINCPSGSDPAAGMELSEYLTNNLKNIFLEKKDLHSLTLSDGIEEKYLLENSTYSTQPYEGDLIGLALEKTNVTINSLYPIFIIENSTISYNYTLYNDSMINLCVIYNFSSDQIVTNIYMTIYTEEGENISFIEYNGNIDNPSSQLFNYIEYTHIKINSTQGDLITEEYVVTGDNDSYSYTTYFQYSSVIKYIQEYGNLLLNNEDIYYISESILINNSGLHDYRKVTIQGFQMYGYTLKVSDDEIIVAECGTKVKYNWEANISGTLVGYNLYQDGQTIDPSSRIKKTYYTKWGQKTGVNLIYHEKWSPKDVDWLGAAIVGGVTFIGLVALYFSATGVPLIVAAVVSGILIVGWEIFKAITLDPDNNDIELSIRTNGKYNFLVGGTLYIGYYRWDCNWNDPTKNLRLLGNPGYCDALNIRNMAKYM
ncbi:MAG: hypothetical protein QCI82_12040, partial [Candidatus Thermoplasmatota archaeon]|nr:hypothetical protein [Candidatus Thermoplasmatota archaeon]